MLSFLSLASNTFDLQDTHGSLYIYIILYFTWGKYAETCTCQYYATRERSLTWRKGILITSHNQSTSHLTVTFGTRRIVRMPLTCEAFGSKIRTTRLANRFFFFIFQFCYIEKSYTCALSLITFLLLFIIILKS